MPYSNTTYSSSGAAYGAGAGLANVGDYLPLVLTPGSPLGPDAVGRVTVSGTFTGASVIAEKCYTAAEYAANAWTTLVGVVRLDTMTPVSGAVSLTNSTTNDFALSALAGLYAVRLRLTALSTGTVATEGTTYPGTPGNQVATISVANATSFPNGITVGSLINESSATGITAHAGGGQGAAQSLVSEINNVTTVATAGDSVALPPAVAGLTILVINTAANSCQVFGAGTDTINGVATGTGVPQMGKSVCFYVCPASGAWYTEGVASGYAAGYATQSTANGLTARAGGGQGSATALPAMLNRVTTVATTGDSVVLPTNANGMQIAVYNAASNSCNVFPDSGAAINALGTNTAFALAGGKNALFSCLAPNVWHAILSA